MRKENFVIGMIAVAAVAFFFGRLSVSTTKRAKSDATTVKADKAKSNAGNKAGGADAPTAATANKKAAAPARVAGSLNVVNSPAKGPATAKVTIIEISDFQ